MKEYAADAIDKYKSPPLYRGSGNRSATRLEVLIAFVDVHGSDEASGYYENYPWQLSRLSIMGLFLKADSPMDKFE